MFNENFLPPDPDNPGWVIAWGVVKSEKWDLAGVYGNQEDANAKAEEMGDDYQVHFGSHKLGTKDFIWND